MLRDFRAQLSIYRRSDPEFSQQLRENRPSPWAKAWNEELVPLMHLADGLGLQDGERFILMPEGHEHDGELVVAGERCCVQVTVADPVWLSSSFPAGQLHALKLQHSRSGEPAWGGANLSRNGRRTVSVPHAEVSHRGRGGLQAGLVAAVEGESGPTMVAAKRS